MQYLKLANIKINTKFNKKWKSCSKISRFK